MKALLSTLNAFDIVYYYEKKDILRLRRARVSLIDA